MNTEDKKILELLKKNQAINAPDNFTDNVMNSIIEFEESKKPVIQTNTIIASLLMLAAVLVSIGVFYFFDTSLIEVFTSYFAVVFKVFTHQFAWFNTYLVLLINFVQQYPFAFGLAFILIVLLSFDKIFSKGKTSMNMLTIV